VAKKEDRMTAPARVFPGDMLIGEFLKFARSRPKEEYWQLVEGVAVMMNPPRLIHQLIATNLRDLIKEALEIQGLDLLVLNEIGVRVPGLSNFLPRPDVVVFPGVTGDEVYADRFLLWQKCYRPPIRKA
jgi:Uma2 family endonuclease